MISRSASWDITIVSLGSLQMKDTVHDKVNQFMSHRDDDDEGSIMSDINDS